MLIVFSYVYKIWLTFKIFLKDGLVYFIHYNNKYINYIFLLYKYYSRRPKKNYLIYF